MHPPAKCVQREIEVAGLLSQWQSALGWAFEPGGFSRFECKQSRTVSNEPKDLVDDGTEKVAQEEFGPAHKVPVVRRRRRSLVRHSLIARRYQFACKKHEIGRRCQWYIDAS
jgi:hypothetical protein